MFWGILTPDPQVSSPIETNNGLVKIWVGIFFVVECDYEYLRRHWDCLSTWFYYLFFCLTLQPHKDLLAGRFCILPEGKWSTYLTPPNTRQVQIIFNTQRAGECLLLNQVPAPQVIAHVHAWQTSIKARTRHRHVEEAKYPDCNHLKKSSLLISSFGKVAESQNSKALTWISPCRICVVRIIHWMEELRVCRSLMANHPWGQQAYAEM